MKNTYTMNRVIKVFLVTILTLTSCVNQKEKNTDNKEDFVAVETLVQNIFDDIWGAKNETLITKYHTDDFVLLEHGEVWTNDTIANWCKQAKLRDKGIKRINSFDFFKAKKEGHRIWMEYHNYATFKKDSIIRKLEWLESIVAVKKDTVWKLELMHSTRVPRRPN